MKTNDTKCPDCGKEKKLKCQTCIPCSVERQKKKNKLRRLEKYKTSEKVTGSCLNCKNEFISSKKLNQKFCKKECSKIYRTKNSNLKFIERNLDDKPRKDSDKVEYARVSKKPTGWMKKFKACRG